RGSMSASGTVGAKFDVGPYHRDVVALIEVDPGGRRRRTEDFAADRLGDAVVRLYERYAELLPDGPERRRIAATARSVASQVGPLDLDRLASAMTQDVAYHDHRIVGFGSIHGVPQYRAALSTLFEAAADLANRIDDVLALRADTLLVRMTNSGTERAGGGIFERSFLMLQLFAPDGLMTRLEQFDVGHESEALARLDELAAAAPAVGVENAVTRALERVRDTWAARDWGGFAALLSPNFRIVERRRMVQLELGRDQWLASLLPLLQRPPFPTTVHRL